MTEQFMENISNEEHERLLLLCGHGVGPSLSPAARAIVDAWESEWSKGSLCHDQRSIAAVLRAAADQLDHPTSAHTLYAFADELENQ